MLSKLFGGKNNNNKQESKYSVYENDLTVVSVTLPSWSDLRLFLSGDFKKKQYSQRKLRIHVTIRFFFQDLVKESELSQLSKALKSHSNLQLTSLVLEGNSFCKAAESSLLTALQSKRFVEHLESLEFLSNEDSDKGIRVISKAFKTNSASILKKLAICSSPMYSTGMTLLVPCLDAISSLTTLNLARNTLKDQEIRILSLALEHQPLAHLEELDLTGNVFSNEGLVALSHAIEVNTSLQLVRLILAENLLISNLTSLSQAFQRNPQLRMKSLILDGTSIGNKGVEVLSEEMAPLLPSLEVLGLRRVGVGGNGVQRLSCAIRSGKFENLKALVLKENGIGQEGTVELFKSTASSKIEIMDSSCSHQETYGPIEKSEATAIGYFLQMSRNLKFLDVTRFGVKVEEEEMKRIGFGMFLNPSLSKIGLNGAFQEYIVKSLAPIKSWNSKPVDETIVRMKDRFRLVVCMCHRSTKFGGLPIEVRRPIIEMFASTWVRNV